MKKILSILGVCMIFTATEAIAETKDFIIGDETNQLACTLQTPNEVKSTSLVIIYHGLNIDKEMPLLTKIADALEAVDIASLRCDFNGHGKSYGTFEDMTIVNEINDAMRVYEYAKNHLDFATISFVGHSQGAVIAGMLAGELGTEKIKSVVLLAPASNIKDNAQKGDFFGIKFDVENLPPYLELPDGHKLGKAYLETAQSLPIDDMSQQYQGNVLIVHGTQDELVPYTYGVKYYEFYDKGKIHLIKNANHNFVDREDDVARITADYFNRYTSVPAPREVAPAV